MHKLTDVISCLILMLHQTHLLGEMENSGGKSTLAEGVGFEPTDACTSPVFKTGAFDHSATLPEDRDYTGTLWF